MIMMILIRRVRRTKKYKQGNNIRKTEEKQYERKRERKKKKCEERKQVTKFMQIITYCSFLKTLYHYGRAHCACV